MEYLRTVYDKFGVFITVVLFMALFLATDNPSGSGRRLGDENINVVARGGDSIEVIDNGNNLTTCSITFSHKFGALTAGHCGEVGSAVLWRGKKVGTVVWNGLEGGGICDIAVVEWASGSPDYQPMGDIVDYVPKVGDEYALRGGSSGEFDGHLRNTEMFQAVFYQNQKALTASVFHIDASGRRGDSGGPVAFGGRLVGVIQGGDLGGSTYITFLDQASSAKYPRCVSRDFY